MSFLKGLCLCYDAKISEEWGSVSDILKESSPFKADFVTIRPEEHIQGSLNEEGNILQTKEVSCHHVS